MKWVNYEDVRTRSIEKFIGTHLGQGSSFNKVSRPQPVHSDLTKDAVLLSAAE